MGGCVPGGLSQMCPNVSKVCLKCVPGVSPVCPKSVPICDLEVFLGGMSPEVFQKGATTRCVPEMRPKSASEKSVQVVCPRGVSLRCVSQECVGVCVPTCVPRCVPWCVSSVPQLCPKVQSVSQVCYLKCVAVGVY